VYSRNVNGRELTFGVSGLLYKANVLMYDRQTDSLWSQVRREAVAGPMTGTRLKVLSFALTTWDKWREKHPDTQVLSRDTGHSRDYSRDPYASYYQDQKGFFSFFRTGPGEEEKALVVGVTIGAATRAYPLDLLRKKGPLTDALGERKLILAIDPATDQVTVRDDSGNEIPFVAVYWFVWKGMYPQTEMYPEQR